MIVADKRGIKQSIIPNSPPPPITLIQARIVETKKINGRERERRRKTIEKERKRKIEKGKEKRKQREKR